MEKGLSAWQLTMMALGTVVGGSFFLGSAVGIRAAGTSILFSYLLGGGLVYVILYALSEMTVADPAPGSFRTFAEKAFGPAAGFVVGWVYWTALILAMSSEAIVVSTLLRAWIPGLSLPLGGSLVIAGVTLLNLLGADRLSKLESGLAAVKLLAVAGFVVLGVLLIGRLMPRRPELGPGALAVEPLLPPKAGGIAGSMLTVMFAYAGFEVIGLAASEAADPHRTVPRAIRLTVFSLVGLYLAAIVTLLALVPIRALTTARSPMVTALTIWGLEWVGSLVNFVLVTAVLSTMLAAMFGLGRMIRAQVSQGHAPSWLGDPGDVPYRGILFSGAAILAGLGLGFLLPRQVYLFLVSSGGFALLFCYVVILASHYALRRRYGCPPKGRCQLPGFPFTTLAALTGCVLIILGAPLVPGQGSGLLAGAGLVVLFIVAYRLKAIRA